MLVSRLSRTLLWSSDTHSVKVYSQPPPVPSFRLLKMLTKDLLLSALLSVLAPQAAAQGGVITVNCAALQGSIQRADPLIYPGVQSPHVHVAAGGTAFGQSQTNAQAVAARATTCDKALDKSSYWQPQLYHHNANGTFNLVTMTGPVCFPARS